MELVVGVNTYVTRLEADEFIHAFYTENDPLYQWWSELSIEHQEIYLVRSARVIDRLPLAGYPTVSNQIMAFPRSGELDVPDIVKEAQIINAHFVAVNEPDPILARGVKKYTIDNISEEFFGQQSSINQMCSFDTINLLADWLHGGFIIR